MYNRPTRQSVAGVERERISLKCKMEKLIFSLVISFLAISQGDCVLFINVFRSQIVCLEVQLITISLLSLVVSALHCWRCSSDTLNGQFCADPFNANLLTEAQKQWYYVECPLPTNSTNSFIPDNARPVCKKIIQQGETRSVIEVQSEDSNSVHSSERKESIRSGMFLGGVDCCP